MAILILVSFFGGAAASATQKDTAKSHLAAAHQAAEAIFSDAKLWQIAQGSFVQFSGALEKCDPAIPQTGWTYFFWSPSGHIIFEVMVCHDTVKPKNLGGSKYPKKTFLDPEFIDTDELGRITASLLKKEKCSPLRENFGAWLRFDTESPQLIWAVTVPCNDDRALVGKIEAKTGKVISATIGEAPGGDQ